MLGVARLLPLVEGGFAFALADGVLMQLAHLLPDLGRAGHSPERGLNLRGQACPEGQEDRNRQERHAQKPPDLAGLRARIIPRGGLQDRCQPRQAKDAEPCVGLVDPGKAPRAAGFDVECVCVNRGHIGCPIAAFDESGSLPLALCGVAKRRGRGLAFDLAVDDRLTGLQTDGQAVDIGVRRASVVADPVDDIGSRCRCFEAVAIPRERRFVGHTLVHQ